MGICRKRGAMSAIPIVLCSILYRTNTLLHNILVSLLVVYVLVGANIFKNRVYIRIFAYFSKFVSSVNIPKNILPVCSSVSNLWLKNTFDSLSTDGKYIQFLVGKNYTTCTVLRSCARFQEVGTPGSGWDTMIV